MLAAGVIDLACPPDQTEKLTFKVWMVQQDNPTAVQYGLDLLVNLRLRELRDAISDTLALEVLPESLARVGIAHNGLQPVLLQRDHEPLNRLPRIKRRSLSLVHNPVKNRSALGVPVRDAKRCVIR